MSNMSHITMLLPPLETKRVVDLYILLCELEKCACAKVGDAKVENKKLERKLIVLMFNMED
jgi:hypothetical protein